MNNNWECYLCGNENDFNILPNGYLANYHPLCINCANKILRDKKHKRRNQLSFHSKIGDLVVIGNNIFPISQVN